MGSRSKKGPRGWDPNDPKHKEAAKDRRFRSKLRDLQDRKARPIGERGSIVAIEHELRHEFPRRWAKTFGGGA